MPFPQTKEEIYELNDDDIRIFAELLKTEGLFQPLPKRDSLLNKHQQQPQSVRDVLIDFFWHDVKWYHSSTDKNGWQTWLYNNPELDKQICINTKKLGHILNKLAELHDDELTESFVKKIAEKLKVDLKKSSELLQKFHIFTKTPSTSRRQNLIISVIEKSLSDYFQTEVKLYREASIIPLEKPYICGFSDAAFIFIDKNKKTHLFIIEYDGIQKKPNRIEERNARYFKVSGDILISGDQYNINHAYVIYGNSTKELEDRLLNLIEKIESVKPSNKISLFYLKKSSTEGTVASLICFTLFAIFGINFTYF